jgi:hypothetical protein
MTTTIETTRRRDDALAQVEPPTVNLAAMFERLALNPDIPVDKLQTLMEMQRTIMREQAEQRFHMAMSAAQAEMRPVAADAENPSTKSRYASYEALDRAIRPIYTAHSFGLSFDTSDSPLADHIRVLCYVTHGAGHARTYRVDMPADGKGAKGGDVMTKTHAAGAAMSYGMRYLLKLIWNIAVGEDDTDGNSASAPTPPAGYEAWALDLKATADEGLDALNAAWQASKPAFREFLAKRNPQAFNLLKQKAAKAWAK